MHAIRDWLFVGTYRDTCDPWLLAECGVGAMLQLAEAAPQEGIVSRCLLLDDGRPIPEAALREGLAFVREQRAAGRRVLIACGVGRSRSVALAVAAVREAEGLSLLDALRAVRRCHPEPLIHPAIWDSLARACGDPTSYRDAFRVMRAG